MSDPQIIVTIEPKPDRGYRATISSKPDCVAEGEDVPDVLIALADQLAVSEGNDAAIQRAIERRR